LFTSQIAPKGLRKVLNYIKHHYGSKWEVVVTENGFIDGGEITDARRIVYLAVSKKHFRIVMHINLTL
jgi:beta-glucosidase/6-phospho-beta-glucosidase/beta-galactosidase